VIDYRSLTRTELEQWAGERGFPAYRGRQLFHWIWTPGFRDFSAMSDLPGPLRSIAAAEGRLAGLSLDRSQSSGDGTIKLGWRLSDGASVESVLIPESGHTTLCVSTQVGCAMGCTFCLTARMGFHRQLSAGEIAGQALAAMEYEGTGQRLRNLVFMGMGEPLANYSNLLKAIAILTDDLGLNFSLRRITVSTCGLLPEMLRLGQDTDVGLAVSLHAPDDELRGRIMPINRKYPLPRLVQACRDYPLARRRRITFEYLLLAAVNDGPDHAGQLACLLHGIPSKINLIPFNECPDLSFRRPSETRILAFQKVLVRAGYTAIIRKTRGQDISAACGQLYASC